MKRILLILLGAAVPLCAQESTLAPGESFAWGSTTGWMELRHHRPAPLDGLRVKDTHLCGYGWCGTTGWINFGDGTPANSIRYGNADGSDFGVNHDGAGNLSGLAWSATCGWINFGWATAADPNRPRFELISGVFSGYAWSSTAGWISLGTGRLQTEHMVIADTDADGISDAWEYEMTSMANGGESTPELITLTATGDADGDGVSDKDEYYADTNPLSTGDKLEITGFEAGNTSSQLTWTSKPTRLYRIFHSTNMQTWFASLLNDIVADPARTTTRAQPHPAGPRRFFRVGAVLPLQP